MSAVPIEFRKRPGAEWPSVDELRAVSSSVDRAFGDLEELKIRVKGLLDTECAPSILDGATHPGTEYVGYLSLLNESLELNLGELRETAAWFVKARDALAVELAWPSEVPA